MCFGLHLKELVKVSHKVQQYNNDSVCYLTTCVQQLIHSITDIPVCFPGLELDHCNPCLSNLSPAVMTGQGRHLHVVKGE